MNVEKLFSEKEKELIQILWNQGDAHGSIALQLKLSHYHVQAFLEARGLKRSWKESIEVRRYRKRERERQL